MKEHPPVGCYTVDEVTKIVFEATREAQKEIERLRVEVAILKMRVEKGCNPQHLFQYTGQATAAGKIMRCERCGATKTEVW